ncbi:MAG: DUF5615 family PIN-like protein [Nitrococcus sp.]|nr:DUF5615 family PIN-like protein [Nitrococcus sp.]
MKLIADENIAAPLARALRNAGVDIIYVAEFTPGISDDEVLELAKEQHRLLLTEDKDFGELVFRMKRGLPGVIMMRLPEGPWESKWARLNVIIDRHRGRLRGSYTVIEKARVRFRRLPGVDR